MVLGGCVGNAEDVSVGCGVGAPTACWPVDRVVMGAPILGALGVLAPYKRLNRAYQRPQRPKRPQ